MRTADRKCRASTTNTATPSRLLAASELQSHHADLTAPGAARLVDAGSSARVIVSHLLNGAGRLAALMDNTTEHGVVINASDPHSEQAISSALRTDPDWIALIGFSAEQVQNARQTGRRVVVVPAL